MNAFKNNISPPFFIRDKIYVDNFCLPKDKLYEYNFRYLDSISNFCKVNQIKLYFFQSPIRKGLLEIAGNKLAQSINLHVNRVKKILEKDGHFFVNCFDKSWDDSLFVDGFHMNAEGAKMFTKYSLNKINSQNDVKN